MIIKTNLNKEELKEQKLQDTAWANYIKERDGWACSICGSIYAPNAHHIIPREIKEYRYMWDNGITLCRSCHKFSRRLSAHNNPLAFFMWLEKYRPSAYLKAKERMREFLQGEVQL